MNSSYNISAALEALRTATPALGSVIDRVGPIAPTHNPVSFASFASAIIGQQVSGAAARSIEAKVVAGVGALDADLFADHDPESLRAFGLSRQKASYLLDLAERTRKGEIHYDGFAEMDDAEIIRELTAVRGIGVWTVQMVLIFDLGRPDVWPTLDLGVAEGLRRLDGLSERLRPKAMEARGEVWRPYRSFAALYLWRIKDEDVLSPSSSAR